MVKTRGTAVTLVLAFFTAIITVVPLWYLAVQSFSAGTQSVVDELLQARTLSLVLRSLTLTLSVTLASIVLGVFAAWVVAIAHIRGRVALTIVFSLPLAIPSYLAGFAWISWLPGLAGFWGAFIVLSLACYPYVMLPVMAAMSRLDPVHEDVARAMGRTPLAIMWEVVLPQLRRPIASGGLLVALYALSDFGAVAVMRHEVFTWVIYGAYRAGFNPTRAATLSLVLIVAALALTYVEFVVRGRHDISRAGSAARLRKTRLSLPMQFGTLIGIVMLVLPAVGVPIISVITWMQRETTRVVEWSSVWQATSQSLVNGSVTAIATLLLSFPVAWATVRIRTRFARIPEFITYITHSLPGIVVAISVVYVGIRAARPLYQEFPMLIFGQVIIFIPVMVASIRSALEKAPPALEDVSRSLGVTNMATLFRVTLPIALPGVLAGTALTMLAAVKELPVTLLLRPTGMDTLSTRIWDYSAVSDYAAMGPYALAILVLAALPTALLGTLSVVKASDS